MAGRSKVQEIGRFDIDGLRGARGRMQSGQNRVFAVP